MIKGIQKHVMGKFYHTDSRVTIKNVSLLHTKSFLGKFINYKLINYQFIDTNF